VSRRDRQQRYQARQREGRMVLPIEVDDRVISWLVQHHWLPAREFYERTEVSGAITAMLRVSSRDC
jgi:hypothetical protein